MEPSMETLEIIDCSGIPQNVLAKAITDLKGLRYLLLTHAGRVFGQESVESLIQSKAQLWCLSISGAYLFKDEDAERVIRSNPALQSLKFDTCPLLGPNFVRGVAETSGLLELSLQELTLSPDALQELSRSTDALRNIKSLTLRSIAGLTDELLAAMLQAIGPSLEALDVSDNQDLSDTCLSGIRQFSTRLRSLSMNRVKELTSVGLVTLFSRSLEGLPPPPKLKLLELGSCDHQAVTDDVLELVTASASVNYGIASASFVSRGGGLVQLDVQGSTLVTDVMLEKLVETSSNTMIELNVSYCPLITDKGLGYLVSKAGNQLARIHVWGCAQLSDEFFDGQRRVNDQTLEIHGAWMKKSGMRSLR
jgi:hypothetical protein